MTIGESTVEEAVLEWVGELGYAIGHGPHIALVEARRSTGEDPGNREADPEQVGLPAGPAGSGCEDGAAAGGMSGVV